MQSFKWLLLSGILLSSPLVQADTYTFDKVCINGNLYYAYPVNYVTKQKEVYTVTEQEMTDYHNQPIEGIYAPTWKTTDDGIDRVYCLDNIHDEHVILLFIQKTIGIHVFYTNP